MLENEKVSTNTPTGLGPQSGASRIGEMHPTVYCVTDGWCGATTGGAIDIIIAPFGSSLLADLRAALHEGDGKAVTAIMAGLSKTGGGDGTGMGSVALLYGERRLGIVAMGGGNRPGVQRIPYRGTSVSDGVIRLAGLDIEPDEVDAVVLHHVARRSELETIAATLLPSSGRIDPVTGRLVSLPPSGGQVASYDILAEGFINDVGNAVVGAANDVANAAQDGANDVANAAQDGGNDLANAAQDGYDAADQAVDQQVQNAVNANDQEEQEAQHAVQAADDLAQAGAQAAQNNIEFSDQDAEGGSPNADYGDYAVAADTAEATAEAAAEASAYVPSPGVQFRGGVNPALLVYGASARELMEARRQMRSMARR